MILNKPYLTEEYAQLAIYANENNLIIEDKGEYLEAVQPPVVELTYAQKRALEYPEISEQLDLIYWDKINNTNNWQEKIAEIKDKYPKV